MGALVSGLVAVTAFFWFILATSDQSQWVADNVCPTETKIIRYPQHLGGAHPAVCNPTGRNWQ